MGCPADPPAHDVAGVNVDDEGDIDKARPCRDIGEVRHPQPVGSGAAELAVDVVKRTWTCLVLNRRSHRFAPDNAPQSHVPHQSLHRAAGHIAALALELPPDFADAVDPEVLLEDAGDLGLQAQVPLRPAGKLLRIGPLGHMAVIGGRGDRQNLADRLDPMVSTMIIDEADHLLNGRSSSAWAK